MKVERHFPLSFKNSYEPDRQKNTHTIFLIPYVSDVIHESINITTTWKPISIHYYSHYYNL